MPRDGSGNYSLPSGNPVVTNTVISSSGWANPTLTDIAAALTGSISRDGQSPPTADLSMGNFKLRNLAPGILATDAANVGQVQSGALTTLGAVGGTDTITASTSPAITAYAANQTFEFMPAGTNTTNAVTLNLNGLGAKNVYKSTPAGVIALAPGDIVAAVMQTVIYDGTQFQLQNPSMLNNHGQCRLAVQSGTVLILRPYNGNVLIVNGSPQQIPAAGVTVTNAGLVALTLYYVYAFMNSGTMTLECVTTPHVTGTNGVEQKSGDPTRTFVGMAYMDSGVHFVDDSLLGRFTRSWFNRPRTVMNNVFTNGTSSSTDIALSQTPGFIAYADDPIVLTAAGSMSINAVANGVSTLYLDGFGVGNVCTYSAYAASASGAIACNYPGFVSEGFHSFNLRGRTGSSAAGTWTVDMGAQIG